MSQSSQLVFGSFLPKATLSVGEEAEELEAAFFLDKLLTLHLFLQKTPQHEETILYMAPPFTEGYRVQDCKYKAIPLGLWRGFFVGFGGVVVCFCLVVVVFLGFMGFFEVVILICL